MREIITNWNLVSGGGHVSVMYFVASDPVATQRTNLNTMWTAIKALQSTNTLYDIALSGREIESTTGALTGAWSTGAVLNGAGSNGTTPVPDVAQALIQWRTSQIVNGRFLRGRTYVPGIATGQVVGGNVAGGAVTILLNAASALAGSTTPPHIWHRPVSGSGGNSYATSSVTIWSEFAMLKRRRN